MVGKFIIVATAVLVAAHANSAIAQEVCGPPLNHEGTDVRLIVDEIALRTGRKFVVDPRVQGTVTIKSGPESELCADETWELFQASLRVIGYTAAPISGQNYRIIPIQEGARAAGSVGDGERGDFVTQIVRLRHVDAREAAANIAQIVGERGVVAPVRSGNAIIIVDTSENVDRLRQVLKEIDRDTSQFKSFALKNASAREVASVVRDLARDLKDDNNSGATVSIVPVDASNSVLVRAEPQMIARLQSVIAELDRIGGVESDLAVITLNHSDAEEMATLLQNVANASAGGTTSNVVTGRSTISFHKPTNSVIINGDAKTQRMLKEVVAKLDVRRAQVLVEAIIVEVSDSTARELGIQYFVTGTEGSRVPFSTTNFSSAQPNILAAAGTAILDGRANSSGDNDGINSGVSQLADTAIQSLLGINGFALGGAGQTSDGTIFGAILTAIKQDKASNVLSTPSVVTLDNKLATLSVGQEIPITTGEAIGDNFSNAFRTVSREQVGVILEVTPQINDGGTVTLEIRQETSSVNGQIISSSTDLITNKREIATTALVDDGDILIIGGLIDEQTQNREDKVPVLGDIPVAGNLFKTQARSKERKNLMVFIRPTILRDRSEAGSATRKKFDYIRARQMLESGNPVSDVELLIDQVTGIDKDAAGVE